MKKVVILISLLIVFISLSAANSIHQKQSAEIKDIKKSIAEEQQRGDFLKKIAEAESRIKRYRLSTSKEIRWLLKQVSNIADQTGVSLISISPRPLKEEDQYVSLAVNAEIRCNYDQFGNFVSKLENSPQLIRLENVQLSVIRKSRDDIRPLANVKLIISTLYLR